VIKKELLLVDWQLKNFSRSPKGKKVCVYQQSFLDIDGMKRSGMRSIPGERNCSVELQNRVASLQRQADDCDSFLIPFTE
jgi:hypothetical protein